MRVTVRQELGSLSHGLFVMQPFDRIYERDKDGTYIVSDSFSIVYGTGQTSDEAYKDWVDAMDEYYELLESLDKGPKANPQFARLREFVRRFDGD